MKGRVTEYSQETKTGTIQGDDGYQYHFTDADWKAGGVPAAEVYVGFGTHEFRAKSIQLAATGTASFGIFDYYLECMRKYVDFSGRARRREYWLFGLFNMVIALGVMIVDELAGTLPYLYLIYVLGIMLPSWAVSVRRLHDVGKSGWFLLIVLIPVIGGIWLFILHVLDGESGMNQYGPNPKEALG